jgi:CubicO group peptidase (beta-lactamase class C family)
VSISWAAHSSTVPAGTWRSLALVPGQPDLTRHSICPSRGEDSKATTHHAGGGMHVSVPAGSIWKYNTVAYQTACHCTLAAAAGSSAQGLTREWVLEPIGCSAASEWRPRVKDTDPPNNGDSTMMPHTVGFFSSPRDMIRLGLLLLGDGRWNGEAIVSTAWLDALSSSCETNAAYGYLWWLNGKSSVSSPGRAGPGKLS